MLLETSPSWEVCLEVAAAQHSRYDMSDEGSARLCQLAHDAHVIQINTSGTEGHMDGSVRVATPTYDTVCHTATIGCTAGVHQLLYFCAHIACMASSTAAHLTPLWPLQRQHPTG